MEMPFYFFFGLLGLAVGALVVWLLLAEHPFEGPEPPIGPVDKVEATLLARALAKRGRPVDEETVVDLIELHTAYLEGRISDELALTEADRIEAARAKAESDAEAAQTAPAQAADAQTAAQAAAGAAAAAASPARSRARAARSRKSTPAAPSPATEPAAPAPAKATPRARATRPESRPAPTPAPTYDVDLPKEQQ